MFHRMPLNLNLQLHLPIVIVRRSWPSSSVMPSNWRKCLCPDISPLAWNSLCVHGFTFVWRSASYKSTEEDIALSKMQIDLQSNWNIRLYLEETKYWACQGAQDCHQCKETAVKYDLHIKFQRSISKESVRGGRISTHLQGGVSLSCVWQIWPTTNAALWIRRRGENWLNTPAQ